MVLFVFPQQCEKAWTSMKGRVIFVYELNQSTGVGIVNFWLPGQKCQDCTNDAPFVHAMWYPDEVEKASSCCIMYSLKTGYMFFKGAL